MNKKLLLTLRKMILEMAEVVTDNGTLYTEGPLEVGIAAYTEDGEPATDGEYHTEDGLVITIENGIISEIKEPEAVEAPAEEAPVEPAPEELEEPAEPEEAPADEPDEKDAKIAELEARIAELEAENEELKAKLEEAAAKEEELNTQLSMSAAEPAAVKAKTSKKPIISLQQF